MRNFLCCAASTVALILAANAADTAAPKPAAAAGKTSAKLEVTPAAAVTANLISIREAIELCLETKDQEGWALPQEYEVVDINIIAA